MNDTAIVARGYAEIVRAMQSAVVTLDGPMGSGKTTLAGLMIAELDPKIGSHSPTFSIINKHRAKIGGAYTDIYHMDLYRIRDESELDQLGLDEILTGRNIVFIEWPNRLGKRHLDLFKNRHVKIEINPHGDVRRFKLYGFK